MSRLPIIVALLVLLSGAALADVTGKPRVIDGDTIEIGGERIRLYGIDAPEANQTCRADGKEWACGQEAIFALAFEMAEHWITCTGDARDAYGQLIAVCTVGPYDLNARIVRGGWALALRQHSMDYVDEENEAKMARRGVWQGEFVPPWEWRSNSK